MDKIVEEVVTKYRQRSEVGIEKYGTTLDENKATLIEWLNHLQEELMDATLYIQKLKSDLDK
jgi:tRNA A37 threonylcarbamoyladenosine biosynthesis protein TsaE